MEPMGRHIPAAARVYTCAAPTGAESERQVLQRPGKASVIRLAATCAACLAVLVTACTDVVVEPGDFVTFEDEGGRFSIALPPEWEIDPTSSRYRLFAGLPASESGIRYDATLGLTWGPLPCDRVRVDDVLEWYAERLLAAEGCVGHSRTETVVDSRRALLLDSSVSLPNGDVSRELTLVTEGYGVIWQVTCRAVDGERFREFEGDFRAMLASLKLSGSWQ